ncbi:MULTISPECIES: GNAT family N-acetyltransferase [Methylorubrum]|uniref:GNAT family N-acetyltransferase n=1 Tax=Methylorubrum TaxID=2282523 RepID=UPI0020A1BCFF|nr:MULTISPECIES: GNAT family N-acetyltransferase [Methylorubrum]MCP1549335.1 GNAT superfamily N-acetyltransferase [Methylorubrum zatmanii]MCP1554052.1 GNAT superfamily N-acetyltransferase [Methylorubrum extorquens]MCP1579637.1 GNAT superfamily N-acetyltransferase [Methylorubrum extorquens]
MTEPQLYRSRSGADDIRAHLMACASTFTPPLDWRVVIPDYATKLATCSERFEAWDGTALIGLVAVYCNDPIRATAFVTSVSIVPERTREGLGRRLLTAAITHVHSLGFARIALSVDREAAALALYHGLGFAEDTRNDRTLHLSLDLTAPCSGTRPNAEAASRNRN